jgi:hypothetical protein
VVPAKQVTISCSYLVMTLCSQLELELAVPCFCRSSSTYVGTYNLASREILYDGVRAEASNYEDDGIDSMKTLISALCTKRH